MKENGGPGGLTAAVDQEVIERVVEKYDLESQYRKYSKISRWGTITSVVAIAMSLYQLWLASFGVLPAIKMRAIHLAFVLVLTFLLFPASRQSRRDRPTVLDFIFIAGSIASGAYIVWRYNSFAFSGGFANNTDYAFAVLASLMVLEAGRRCIGKVLPILAILFLSYAYFGYLIPGSFGHQGYTVNRILEMLYLSTDGIFGVAIGVSTSYIFLFILFGAFLGETGMARLINEISLAIAGRSPGGPAKVAVFASGLMGTISGSAVANVATTGAFTIPLMKSVGYKPYFAGAVEAVASTGGQIMPPVMGAAAFIMAEILNVPYKVIMLAAVIPAVLYYLACYVGVHLEAVKTGLKGLPADQLPNTRSVLKERGHLLLPLAVIIYFLVKGYTPTFSAFYGIVAAVLVSSLRKSTRLSWRGFLAALEGGARGAITVAIACAVVGFIVGVSSMTSLGIKLGDNIIGLAGGNLMLTLVLAAITCIILGMGMPTTAVYIVAATMAAPTLVKLGLNPIAAHLFAFYFGNISNITPPVALAAFAGAGIAGASPDKVGWTAVRLGISAFIVPFMFVYSPELVFQAGNAGASILAGLTAIIGVVALGAAGARYLLTHATVAETVLLYGVAMGLIKPGLLTDILGLAGLALVYFLQKKRVKSQTQAAGAKA
ncbi:C4-dicarboxylate ABC transporter permease [Clostridiales bacterium PH28_bin88]|nr:C4-dicarboxylate ABC transporter permease [Clostridiales bacterium PH28_bin88]